MFNFETMIIVLVCSVPVVALLFVLPKIKKKEKQQEKPTKTYEEIKKEEAKPEPVKEEIKTEKPKEKRRPGGCQ